LVKHLLVLEELVDLKLQELVLESDKVALAELVSV
jgi:hypothetical protein